MAGHPPPDTIWLPRPQAADLRLKYSYQLFGQVDGVGVNASFTGYFPGNATVSLAMGSTTIHSVSPNPPDIFGDGTLNAFAFSGVLAPGVYSLNASASASASGTIESYDSSRFAFTLVPEPGIPTCILQLITMLVLRLRKV